MQKRELNMPQDLIDDANIITSQLYELLGKKYDESFLDKNYVKLYSLIKQAKVLRKVAMNRIKNDQDPAAVGVLIDIDDATYYFSEYEFDELEICPQAEELKFKYIQYLKPTIENTKTL